jgi:RND family efflux transporter MFP subunit
MGLGRERAVAVSGTEQHTGLLGLEDEIREPSDAGADAAYLDASLWTRFDQAAGAESAAGAWLAIECARIEGVRCAVVVMGAPETGSFAPLAVWPEGAEIPGELSDAAELAMTEGRGIIQQTDAVPATSAPAVDEVAYPLVVEGRLCGVVALALARRGEGALRAVMRELQWGSAWLELLARERGFASKARLSTVLELVAVCLGHERATAAATALATELAGRIGCERVSVGFLEGGHARVRGLSHSAEFGKKSSLVVAIAAAMDEALEQRATLAYPEPEGAGHVLRAHGELAEHGGSGAICTVPFGDPEQMLGALTFERAARAPFDADAVGLCQHVAAMTGPVLEAKRREDRWLHRKAWDSLCTQLGRLVGPRHVGRKLVAACVVGAAVFLALATGDYRVSADATLEGSVQRSVVAPIAGYVAEANVRAGDVVQEGQLLARLDERDLKLERLRRVGEWEQRRRALRRSQAAHERTEVMILEAQIAQAEAQIALLDAQLARIRLAAPFDGVVVSGDLSQSLGSPVERGAVLFEIAPLDSYRVILSIDERDVAEVAPGQKGTLVLAGLPAERLDLVVEKLTPAATVADGRNRFRVEARLEGLAPALRPGMQGVAKVEAGRRRLAWLWTHALVDWLRLWAWSWWP